MSHVYLDQPGRPEQPEAGSQLLLWDEPTQTEVAAASEAELIGGPFAGGIAMVPDLERYRPGQRILIDKRLPVDEAHPVRAVCQRETYEVVAEGAERRLVWRG